MDFVCTSCTYPTDVSDTQIAYTLSTSFTIKSQMICLTSDLTHKWQVPHKWPWYFSKTYLTSGSAIEWLKPLRLLKLKFKLLSTLSCWNCPPIISWIRLKPKSRCSSKDKFESNLVCNTSKSFDAKLNDSRTDLWENNSLPFSPENMSTNF